MSDRHDYLSDPSKKDARVVALFLISPSHSEYVCGTSTLLSQGLTASRR